MPEPARIKLSTSAGRERVLVGAVDLAREALRDLTRPQNVGEHVGVVVESDRVLTHCFDCLLPGYPGWFWTVTLARIPRSSRPTIDEMSLRPGPEAKLAPDWVPWAERLEPSDIQPTDRLPYNAIDERLEASFEDASEEADEIPNFELGLGRPRVLSPQGRDSAFQRWYEGRAVPPIPRRDLPRPHARRAVSSCSWPDRLEPCSAPAPTNGLPMTAGLSPWIMGAARIRRRMLPSRGSCGIPARR